MMKEQFDISASQIIPIKGDSPLNILYNDYTEGSGTVNPNATALTKDLREMLQQLSADYADDIMDRISLLCAEYQREGFFAGIRTGIKLINEIRT